MLKDEELSPLSDPWCPASDQCVGALPSQVFTACYPPELFPIHPHTEKGFSPSKAPSPQRVQDNFTVGRLPPIIMKKYNLKILFSPVESAHPGSIYIYSRTCYNQHLRRISRNTQPQPLASTKPRSEHWNCWHCPNRGRTQSHGSCLLVCCLNRPSMITFFFFPAFHFVLLCFISSN